MMHRLAAILLVASIDVCSPALACSPISFVDLFTPNIEAAQENGPRADLPAPVVRLVKIVRGTGSDGFSCDDMGSVTLSVRVPIGSDYKANELGVYFREVSGTAPDLIFPRVPLVSLMDDRRNLFKLNWLDGAPEGRVPLNLNVEVFFVSQDLSIGPSTFFTLKEP